MTLFYDYYLLKCCMNFEFFFFPTNLFHYWFMFVIFSFISFCFFKILGVPSFVSGVSAQPIGKEETIKGAKFRAESAHNSNKDATFWVGIENGIFQEEKDSEWLDAACIYIISNNKEWTIWSDTVKVDHSMAKGPGGEW